MIVIEWLAATKNITNTKIGNNKIETNWFPNNCKITKKIGKLRHNFSVMNSNPLTISKENIKLAKIKTNTNQTLPHQDTNPIITQKTLISVTTYPTIHMQDPIRKKFKIKSLFWGQNTILPTSKEFKYRNKRINDHPKNVQQIISLLKNINRVSTPRTQSLMFLCLTMFRPNINSCQRNNGDHK